MLLCAISKWQRSIELVQWIEASPSRGGEGWGASSSQSSVQSYLWCTCRVCIAHYFAFNSKLHHRRGRGTGIAIGIPSLQLTLWAQFKLVLRVRRSRSSIIGDALPVLLLLVAIEWRCSLHFFPTPCTPSCRTDAGVCVSRSLTQVSPSRAALNRPGLLLLIRFPLPSLCCMFCRVYGRLIEKTCRPDLSSFSLLEHMQQGICTVDIRTYILPAVSPKCMLHLGILSYLYAHHVVEYLLQNKPLSVAFLLAYCEQCASRNISRASLEFQCVSMGGEKRQNDKAFNAYRTSTCGTRQLTHHVSYFSLFQAMVQPTYTRGNYTLYYATTMSSTQDDGQLDVVDSIKEKDTDTVRESSNGDSNAYNPYDPKSTPFEIHIAAMTTTGGTTTTTSATSTTSTTGSTMTEMDYDLLNAPVQNAPKPPTSCPWKCELTNDRGYVLYSALGSFYIPMFVMLFFYWRIYRAAVRTTRAINQGFKTTKGKLDPIYHIRIL